MTQGFVNPYTYAVSAPTVTTYTSGSGTYTVPAGVQFLVVEMCGGGGGGSASSTGTPTVGTSGGNTTFGTSLLTANGGAAPVGGTGAVSGGLGGSFTISSPAYGQGFNGGDGGAGAYLAGTTGDNAGGSGGTNPFGGSPTGGKSNTAGTAGYANTGAGGSGGGIGATGTATAGAGGGSGGYLKAVIPTPGATYSYAVGAGGNGGTGYTNGGAGAAGIIIIYEYYQTLGIPTSLTLPLSVNQGGTGNTSATAYGVLCGGTTSAGAHQSIASVGTSGQVLTSNGAGALPTFQSLIGSVQAWVNFNGTGTVAIRASSNVTSITDNGTGDYTINYTTALSSADYALIGTGSYYAGNYRGAVIISMSGTSTATTYSTTATRILTDNAQTDTRQDAGYVCCATFL